MGEAFILYGGLAPFDRGLIFLILGLVAGSFCSMLWHRLPRQRSILGPHSECHSCGHPLGPIDLVPVLSWIWLRGRCRFCRMTIPVRYPIVELAAGLVAGTAGGLGGWSMGLGVVVVWVSATVLLAYRQRQSAESGFSLVEVLIALGLLSGVLIPMLEFGGNLRAGTVFQHQIAASLAASKLEDLGNTAYRTGLTVWPSSGGPEQAYVGTYVFDVEWEVSAFSPANDDYSAESTHLRNATVTVTCAEGCPRPMPPVRMVTVLAKLSP